MTTPACEQLLVTPWHLARVDRNAPKGVLSGAEYLFRSFHFEINELMAKPTKLTSPTLIDPFDTGKKSLRVVIETPKGSRNKFKYDEDLGCYRLNSVLPEGMSFPYDFGFVPYTRAEDGDPLDVLILMDQPAYPGIVVESRIVGVIEAEQTESGKTTRNDRVLAVSVASHAHSDIKQPGDLNSTMIEEVEQFFVAYNREHGKKFKLLGCKGAKTAMKLIEKSRIKRSRGK